jgi:hypothetical protein
VKAGGPPSARDVRRGPAGALGGLVRVSQVQLLQTFLALLFAAPVLASRWSP